MNIEKKSDLISNFFNLKINGLDIKKTAYQDGDFGDLITLEFSKGKFIGDFSIWSNGYIFYMMLDKFKDKNYMLIEEELIDASSINEDDIDVELKNAVSRVADIINSEQ